MTPPIRTVNLASIVQGIQAVTRKPRPGEQEPQPRRRGRSSAKTAGESRETISTASASAELRSSSAVQSALTEPKRGS